MLVANETSWVLTGDPLGFARPMFPVDSTANRASLYSKKAGCLATVCCRGDGYSLNLPGFCRLILVFILNIKSKKISRTKLFTQDVELILKESENDNFPTLLSHPFFINYDHNDILSLC